MKINPISVSILSNANTIENQYGLTTKDMRGCLIDFPIGVCVRILEEVEKQGNKPDISIFQKNGSFRTDVKHNGFNWISTEAGYDFWENVLRKNMFDMFYDKYPEYKKYDING